MIRNTSNATETLAKLMLLFEMFTQMVLHLLFYFIDVCNVERNFSFVGIIRRFNERSTKRSSVDDRYRGAVEKNIEFSDVFSSFNNDFHEAECKRPSFAWYLLLKLNTCFDGEDYLKLKEQWVLCICFWWNLISLRSFWVWIPYENHRQPIKVPSLDSGLLLEQRDTELRSSTLLQCRMYSYEIFILINKYLALTRWNYIDNKLPHRNSR